MNKPNRFLIFDCDLIYVIDSNHIFLTDVNLVGEDYEWAYVSLHFHSNNDATVEFYINHTAFKCMYSSRTVPLSQLLDRPCPII